MFNQSSTALEKAQRFRDERISLICNGYGQRPLEAKGRLFIHIVPVAAFSGMIYLDMEQVYEKRMAFRPLGETDMSPRYNYHGFINERGGPQNFGYTQIFRNGILAATIANILGKINSDRPFIPGLYFEEMVFKQLASYLFGLRDVGVPPPLIIMFTLEGVKGVYYAVNNTEWSMKPQLPESILALPECVLEEYGVEIDHHRAVRPAFDALWNAADYMKDDFFNDDGLWVGEQKR